jgi:hypothetical protein
MNFAEILTSPEGKTLEFKRDTSALKQIMRTKPIFELVGNFFKVTLYPINGRLNEGVSEGVSEGVETLHIPAERCSRGRFP